MNRQAATRHYERDPRPPAADSQAGWRRLAQAITIQAMTFAHTGDIEAVIWLLDEALHPDWISTADIRPDQVFSWVGAGRPALPQARRVPGRDLDTYDNLETETRRNRATGI